tara:strand:+ start:1828 stop:2109 length:282 start_codon:yes stop_codon:yes gene_type:complete
MTQSVKQINEDDVVEYITDELGMKPRHNTQAIAEACNEMSMTHEVEANDVMRLVLSNEPIPSMYTHSYGFHTANGRGLIDEFKVLYNEYNEYN